MLQGGVYLAGEVAQVSEQYSEYAEQFSAGCAAQRESQQRVTAVQNVSYRPYTDLQRSAAKQKPTTKRARAAEQRQNARAQQRQEEEVERQAGTTIEHLYPELLCLVFEQLDLQSKGRVAQVRHSNPLKTAICISH